MAKRDRPAGLRVVATPLEKLTEDPNNARAHPKRNMRAIRESLDRFGQVEPLVVRKKTGVVVGGNGRLRAMREMGWETADVVEVDLTDRQARTLSLALNRTSELAKWDGGRLASELEAIAEMDLGIDELDGIGFDLNDLGKHIDVSAYRPDLEDGDVPGPPKDPVTKMGDVWTLGRHRVTCGDCAAVVLPEYELLLTDPPYGVSYGAKNAHLNARDGGNRIETEIEGDQASPEEMGGRWQEWFTAVRQHAAPGASYYVTGPGRAELLLRLMAALEAAGFPLRHTLVWVKNNHVLGRGDYNFKHEPILYGWVGGAAHRFYGGDGQTTVWSVDKPMSSKIHPTMKPVVLFAKAIENSTRADDIVADPFLGSGTTLIAAEQLDRTCYGIEISPAYCDVIVERWENLTGGKAKRAKG